MNCQYSEISFGITGFSENKLLALESWPEVNTKLLEAELETSFSQLFDSIRRALRQYLLMGH